MTITAKESQCESSGDFRTIYKGSPHLPESFLPLCVDVDKRKEDIGIAEF